MSQDLTPTTVSVLPPTLTKGTQGATGYSTQDLKDAGRQQIMLAWSDVAGTAGTESALTNFTFGTRGGSNITAATSLTVTSGKTLRIQQINIAVRATSTVNNQAYFRLRQAASSIANTSPVIWFSELALELGTTAAGAFANQSFAIPDGLEVASTQQVTFTWLTAANTCTVNFTLVGYEY